MTADGLVAVGTVTGTLVDTAGNVTTFVRNVSIPTAVADDEGARGGARTLQPRSGVYGELNDCYFLPAFSCSSSLSSCSAFSLLVQKFSVRSSLLAESENVRHAEVHGFVSTFGSSIVN